MEAWGDPWAEAPDEILKLERPVLENRQDEAGWRVRDEEAGSRCGQIVKGERSQPTSIQIPVQWHTVSKSIASTVFFGIFPDIRNLTLPMFCQYHEAHTVLSFHQLLDLELGFHSLLLPRWQFEDANKFQFLQEQVSIQDASSNVKFLSSDSLEAACEKDDAAAGYGMPRNVADSSTPDFDPIKQLFSMSGSTNSDSYTELSAILFSISSCKVWYRVTRKEMSREFNMGESDEEYVRVNWAKSNIRKMTVEIVSRFATDDRFNDSESCRNVSLVSILLKFSKRLEQI